MEQKGKKYDELKKYERVMANATLEQRLEAIAKELQQMALALKVSVHVDATYHDWKDEKFATSGVAFINGDQCTRRDMKETGDLFGVIEEALEAKTPAE